MDYNSEFEKLDIDKWKTVSGSYRRNGAAIIALFTSFNSLGVYDRRGYYFRREDKTYEDIRIPIHLRGRDFSILSHQKELLDWADSVVLPLVQFYLTGTKQSIVPTVCPECKGNPQGVLLLNWEKCNLCGNGG